MGLDGQANIVQTNKGTFCPWKCLCSLHYKLDNVVCCFFFYSCREFVLVSSCAVFKTCYLSVFLLRITIRSYISAFKSGVFFIHLKLTFAGCVLEREIPCSISSIKGLEAMLHFSVVQFSLGRVASFLISIEPIVRTMQEWNLPVSSHAKVMNRSVILQIQVLLLHLRFGFVCFVGWFVFLQLLHKQFPQPQHIG